MAKSEKLSWGRRFVVYCDSPEQKELVERGAKESGRSLSRYALLKLLNEGPGEDLVDRLEGAEEQAKRWRDDNTRLRKDLDECDALVRAMESQIEELNRANEMLRDTAKTAEAASRVQVVDIAALQLLVEAIDGEGAYGVVLYKEMVMKMDKAADGPFVMMLERRLDELVDLGAIEKVVVRGHKGYRWRGGVA